jgi:uncharacterized alkaline shock family protein YloU
VSALDLADPLVPSAPLPVPGQRGRTSVADRVVARIATQAVTEVALAGGAARQLIGITIGHQTGQGPARVSARVDGNLAVIELRLTLAYPVGVRGLTREVRRHIIERVTGLTGIEVRHVDIEVARLLPGWPR